MNVEKEKMKKIFTYASIALLSLCAVIGITMVFIGVDEVALKLVSTLLIFYGITLLSTQSTKRLGDKSPLIRCLAIFALIMNMLWVIPWVLLVWDAFGAFEITTRITIWQLLWTAGDLAILCALLASELVQIRWETRIEKFFHSLPMLCTIFLAFDVLIVIWMTDAIDMIDILWKFILAELILIVLHVVVTKILEQDLRRKEKQLQVKQKIAKQREVENANNELGDSDDVEVRIEEASETVIEDK